MRKYVICLNSMYDVPTILFTYLFIYFFAVFISLFNWKHILFEIIKIRNCKWFSDDENDQFLIVFRFYFFWPDDTQVGTQCVRHTTHMTFGFVANISDCLRWTLLRFCLSLTINNCLLQCDPTDVCYQNWKRNSLANWRRKKIRFYFTSLRPTFCVYMCWCR